LSFFWRNCIYWLKQRGKAGTMAVVSD